MRGKYNITVENAFIRYEFTIQRNITVIRGQSATGKTTLVEMIREYNELPDTGINIRCDKTLAVLYGRDWQDRLANISDSIVFIDEQSRFVKTHEFAEAIKGSNNYFVIVTREKLSELPYSVTEIYGIRTRGKYAGLVGEYTANEFYRIYADIPTRTFEPDVIITEDSNSGFDFWNTETNSCKCISAGGKSNIIKCLKEDAKADKKYLAIVDGAAFGAELEEMIQYIKYRNQNVEIYAPESFEYILLTSGLSENVLKSIVAEAKRHGIKELRLFGSRARGDHDERSDIDLAAYGGKIESFKLDIEENVPTLLTFDIVDMEKSNSNELKDIVKREGIVLYEEV